MNARRVVVTGLGCVSALGLNVGDTWEQLCAGRDGASAIALPDAAALRFQRGAQIHHFDAVALLDRRQAESMDRFAQLGMVAGLEAVRDASIAWTPELQSMAAVITGTGGGGVASIENALSDMWRGDRRGMPVMSIPRFMPNALSSQLTMHFGLMGPSYTLSTACASSNHAIGHAYWLVRSGASDIALAGGADSPFSVGQLKAWEALRVIAPNQCRPFSADREGMILGEAGAMLVLEPLDAAVARGAQIYAEIVGFGMSADAHHLTKGLVEGAALAIQRALVDAALPPEAIGYINAHGTGTVTNDAMESAAVRRVFGVHTNRVAVSSTKSMHGHALGASGAIEAVATVLALRHGILPPTANYALADAQCDLDVVPNVARACRVEYALSNSFAFGGLNAVLAFRRWSGGDA